MSRCFDANIRYRMNLKNRENDFEVTLHDYRWLNRLVGDLSPRRTGFIPRTLHAGLMMDRVSLKQVSVRVLRFSSVTTIPVLHTHSFVTNFI